jgi:hypothetical protein
LAARTREAALFFVMISRAFPSNVYFSLVTSV